MLLRQEVLEAGGTIPRFGDRSSVGEEVPKPVLVHDRRATRFERISALYDAIPAQGRAERLQPLPRKGRRGKVPKSRAGKLHQAFLDCKTEILRFARQPEMPFTNNCSERDIRMAGTKQKVSGTFRIAQHASSLYGVIPFLQVIAVDDKCKGTPRSHYDSQFWRCRSHVYPERRRRVCAPELRWHHDRVPSGIHARRWMPGA